MYYQAPTDLVVEDDVILSQEGTTQGDPFGIPMYALATVPLIKRLTSSVKQTWYADDAAATGKITQLRVWWDEMCSLGPSYGYFANGSKSWLVIKEEFKKKAEATFADAKVQIMSEGRPHLGVPISSSTYINQFVARRVQQWSKDIRPLSEICSSQPYAAYTALTHDLSSKVVISYHSK